MSSASASLSESKSQALNVPTAVKTSQTTTKEDPNKIYLVGTDAAYAPFESLGAGNAIVGFDVEVVNAIANKAGIKLQFVNTPWEGIFQRLDTGDRDMVVSAVTITDERKETMDFSESYFDAHQLIIVKSSAKITKFNASTPLIVGVQSSTTGEEMAKTLLGKDNKNIKRFDTAEAALRELEKDAVTAVVADNGVAEYFIKSNGSAKFNSVGDLSFTPEKYGIAVKKGNFELLQKVNKGLAAIKADGTYDLIYSKYFGANAAIKKS